MTKLGEMLRWISNQPARQKFAASLGLIEGGSFGTVRLVQELNPNASHPEALLFVLGLFLAVTGYGVYRQIDRGERNRLKVDPQ